MDWETTIGLEVHIQLKTTSKLFSGAATTFGQEPNTQACIIDLGLPGVLPVLNKEAVKMALKFGLAIDAPISMESIFARKNYFYPDLPKGYQISQDKTPIVGPGTLEIILKDNSTKTIGITRAHLEEDSGKSLHEDFNGQTGIDLNRAGIPLLEIVSEPDMHSAEEAVSYLKALHTLVRYLDICTGNMQEGAFRCDVNVSVRPVGQQKLGTRTETKNLNSFRFVERAINFEVERQINLLRNDQPIIQETRLFDVTKNETRAMRSKEEAQDYRYFPEPDLLPLVISEAMLKDAKTSLPELPNEKRDRFIKDYGLTPYTASLLVNSPEIGDFFEAVIQEKADSVIAANWIMGDLQAVLNKNNLEITQSPINPKQLAQLIHRISDKTISTTMAKTVFEALMEGEESVDYIIKNNGLKQISDPLEINKIIEQVLADNPDELAAYRNGKTKLFGFFVGQVMKLSKGKANPSQINNLLKEKL